MLTRPSFSTGYARNASESANPNLWKGLVGAWMPMMGQGGWNLQDISGRSNDADLIGRFTPGKVSAIDGVRAVNLDAGGDFYKVDKVTDFSPAKVTYSAWMIPTFTATTHYVGGVWRSGRRAWTIRTSNGIATWFTSTDGSSINSAVCTTSYVNNKLINYTGTYDGLKSRIYVNGNLEAETSVSGDLFDSQTEFTMGEILFHGPSSPFGGSWNGYIAGQMVHNRALSPAEIKQLYLNPSAPFQKKTVVAGFVPKTFHKVAVLKKPEPSFVNGYARNASESARPHLWKGLIGAWIPNLGITSSSKVKNVAKNLIEDGTIKNGLQWSQNGFIQNDADEFIQLDNGYVTTEGTVVGSIDALGPLYTRYRQHQIWQSRNWGIIIGGNNYTYLQTSKWDNSGGFKSVVYQNVDHAKSYHAASSFKDGDALKLYVNGAFVGETAYVSSQTQKGYTAKIASYNDQQPGQVNWTGPYNFGPVLLYNRVLSHSEIKELFIKPLAPFERKSTVVGAPAPPPPPVTNYKAVKVIKSHIKPSFKTDYARNASESANPNLWKGLVGAWMPSFGVTGNTLKDVSGNGNDGTLTGMDPANDWVATSKGLALDFDGVNDHVTTDDSEGLFARSGDDPLTVSCWVYPKRFNVYQSIVGNRDDHLSFNFLIYQHQSGGSIQLHGSSQYKSNYVPPYQKWTHICATVGSNTCRVYANAKLVHGPFYYTYWSANPTKLNFGAYSTSAGGQNENFLGGLSNILIYHRALSPTEIKQLYLNPAAPFEMKDTFAAYKDPLPPVRGLFRLP